MKRFMILITAIAAAYLSMPWEAAAQWEDTLWTKYLWPEEVRACRFTPDNKYVLASVGKTLCKYDALTGELISRFKDTCDEVILHVGWSNKCSKIAAITTHENIVYLWDYNQEKIIQTIDIKNDSVKGASYGTFTNDDKYLLIGLLKVDKNNLIVYDMDSQQIIRNLNVEGGKKIIAISPDDKYFVVGSLDYNESEKTFYSHLTLWKTENWEFVKELGYLRDEIYNLRYSSDGRYLICGRGRSWGEPLTVWDMATGNLYKTYYPKESEPSWYENAVFTSDSKFLLLPTMSHFPATIVMDFIGDSIFYKYGFGSDMGIDISNNDKYLLSVSNKTIRVLSPKWMSVKNENQARNDSNRLNVEYKNGLIYLYFKLNKSENVSYFIYDSTGKEITNCKLGYFESGQHGMQYPLILFSGVYFISVKLNDTILTTKFEVIK